MRNLFILITLISFFSCNDNASTESAAKSEGAKADSTMVPVITDSTNKSQQKQLSHQDSLNLLLKEARKTKDSILNALAISEKIREALIDNPTEHSELTNLIGKLNNAKVSVDEFIQKKILDLLKPTNTALKKLIKDISDQKDKLESFVTKIKNISSVVKILTNIIASPIFKEVAPPVIAAANPPVS
jgi:hypothetical protein